MWDLGRTIRLDEMQCLHHSDPRAVSHALSCATEGEGDQKSRSHVIHQSADDLIGDAAREACDATFFAQPLDQESLDFLASLSIEPPTH